MKRSIFDEEHEMFRQAFRSFLDREVVPHFEKWEKDGITPREMILSAGASGLLCMAVPEEYGGAGVDDFRYNIVVAEELTRRLGRERARLPRAHRHHRPVPHQPRHRRAEAPLAARLRQRRDSSPRSR